MCGEGMDILACVCPRSMSGCSTTHMVTSPGNNYFLSPASLEVLCHKWGGWEDAVVCNSRKCGPMNVAKGCERSGLSKFESLKITGTHSVSGGFAQYAGSCVARGDTSEK